MLIVKMSMIDQSIFFVLMVEIVIMTRKFRFEKKVFVASNEHAAEVIGKQGRKIKRIAKDTQTFIQCPSPNDPPIFEIYGHKKYLILRAKRHIQRFADHFDKMKNKKRKIRLSEGEKIETIWFRKGDVPSIIGKGGRQIKKIMFYSLAKVISPDTNKNPIFIIIGTERSIKICILWMKLTAFCSSGNNYFNYNEFSMINDFLHDKNSKDIINIRILQEKLDSLMSIGQQFFISDQTYQQQQSFYNCWNCKVNRDKIARGLCGHPISCDQCIAILYEDVYLKCFYCHQKIENFLIENFTIY